MADECKRYVEIVEAKKELSDAGYSIVGVMHTATITNDNLAKAISLIESAVKRLKRAQKLPRE